MAVNFYVEQADRSRRSGLAAEEGIEPGTLITDTGEGVEQFTTAHEDYGLALFDPEYLAADIRASAFIEGSIPDKAYEVDQRVSYQPSEDAAIVKIRTIDDDGAPSPTIGHRDVIGVADADGLEARIVQEGYEYDANGDGAATTFSRANGNFVAIGRAYRPGRQNGDEVMEHDAPVRTILYSSPKAE